MLESMLDPCESGEVRPLRASCCTGCHGQGPRAAAAAAPLAGAMTAIAAVQSISSFDWHLQVQMAVCSTQEPPIFVSVTSKWGRPGISVFEQSNLAYTGAPECHQGVLAHTSQWRARNHRYTGLLAWPKWYTEATSTVHSGIQRHRLFCIGWS